ncbi:MAG TPA: metal ABC transporter permease [Tepidisphaeraceae bacterium]|nr:metal ABC transporter permease [Tepidisphaeraceae bacterium]
MSVALTWSWQIDGWIVAAGILCAMACALLGNFLVLRKMSMMGDAISHAVLPGLAAAFLITESRDSVPMFIGAAIAGVLTAVLTQWVSRFGKVEESASMGVVFTALFAIGLIMIVRAADKVHLDADCVLYGAIEYLPIQAAWPLLGLDVPKPIVRLAIVLVVNLIVVVVFYKELKISSFDPELATTLGINATFVHYLLMTLVALTTVAAFEIVGSVLVVAMLIVPAAAAHLLTDRLSAMILVSLVLAVVSAVGGHVAAITVPRLLGDPAITDTNTGAMMAVVAGLLFAGAALASPRHGVISKLLQRTSVTLRVAREDLLGLFYRYEELHGTQHPAPAEQVMKEAVVGGPVLGRLALRTLVRRDEVERLNGGYRLTARGRDEARQLVRSHRLWEGYLQSHLSLPVDHLHGPAERLEHVTSPAMREQLAADADPQLDPQGKLIPPK